MSEDDECMPDGSDSKLLKFLVVAICLTIVLIVLATHGHGLGVMVLLACALIAYANGCL
jgi:hypothetical protein